MAKKKNGTLKTVIVIIVGVLTIAGIGAGIVAGFTGMGHQVTDNSEDIEAMQPEVKKNSEYRIKDIEATIYIQEKLDDIYEEVLKK